MASILIVGGTGSLGKKLIERYKDLHTVSVMSRDEAKHWTLRNELRLNEPGNGTVDFYVGDIRDKRRVHEVIVQSRPKIVIIAAALKQVDTCELSPWESVQTNLVGTQNVVEAVSDCVPYFDKDWQIDSVLFVSTDKACSPVNMYGMCKAASERIVTSKARSGIAGIKFLCTRYGNVLESRGSIIPLFKYQSLYAPCLTVTDPDMTRFVMTLDESVDLIQHALAHGQNGETWIPRLPAMRIGDLAELYAEKTRKPIRIIGHRPGEKQHEDLLNLSESARVRKTETHYVIHPAFERGANLEPFAYTSADEVMTKAQLKQHLITLGIFDMELDDFQGLKIEEIVTNRKS